MARCSAAAVLLLCAGPAAAGGVFLGQMPVVAEAGAGLGGPLRVRFLLRPGSTATLPELASRGKTRQVEGAIELLVDGYPVARGGLDARQSQPSFLVDFDEPPVQALREQVIRETSAHPSPEQLARFVGKYIDKKNYRRGQDPASVVARRREGDCKAHAVLLAALNRLFGTPSRMVVGFAIVEGKEGPLAFGHAWAEVFGDGVWRAVDAVDLSGAVGASGPSLRVPLAVVDDEGPAFALSMIEALQDIQSLRLLKD